jgi:hypothetical protein
VPLGPVSIVVIVEIAAISAEGHLDGHLVIGAPLVRFGNPRCLLHELAHAPDVRGNAAYSTTLRRISVKRHPVLEDDTNHLQALLGREMTYASSDTLPVETRSSTR